MRHFLGLVIVLVLAGARAAAEEPADLIERAIKAHGGAEKLAQLRCFQEKTRGKLEVGGRAVPFEVTTLCQSPHQFRSAIKADTGNRKIDVIQVFNGDEAWICDDGKTVDAPAQTLADLREMVHVEYVSSLVPLRMVRGFTLKTLDEIKVNDKPALGIAVTAKERREVKLYFDKETALLVKRVYKSRDAGKESVREEFLSDYKAVEGLQRPHTLLIHQDGKKYAEATLVEFKVLKKIDAQEFKKP